MHSCCCAGAVALCWQLHHAHIMMYISLYVGSCALNGHYSLIWHTSVHCVLFHEPGRAACRVPRHRMACIDLMAPSMQSTTVIQPTELHLLPRSRRSRPLYPAEAETAGCRSLQWRSETHHQRAGRHSLRAAGVSAAGTATTRRFS